MVYLQINLVYAINVSKNAIAILGSASAAYFLGFLVYKSSLYSCYIFNTPQITIPSPYTPLCPVQNHSILPRKKNVVE